MAINHWLDSIGATSTLATRMATAEKLLTGAGVPRSAINYALAHLQLESGLGTSSLARNHRNWSGNKFINNPKLQRAKKGPLSPEGDYYASFAKPADWAQDYRRILSISGPAGAPIAAGSITDFAARLKANRYATDPNYSTKLYSAFNTIAKAKGVDPNAALYKPEYGTAPIKYTGGPGDPTKPITTITPSTETVMYSQDPVRADQIKKGKAKKMADGLKKGNWWKDLPWYGKAGIIVGGAVIAKQLLGSR